MNKNFLFTMIAAATLTGFTACSSDDSVTEGGGEDNNAAEKYISVNIQNVGVTPTRAGDSYEQGGGKYEDGEGQESAINQVYFYFFDTAGQPYNVNVSGGYNEPGGTTGNRYIWTNPGEGNPSEDHNITVEKITTAQIVLRNPTQTLGTMVAVVNPNSDTNFPASMTMADINGASRISTAAYDGTSNGKQYFLMTNSVYDNAGTTTLAVPTEGKVKQSESEAQADPVEIYVERVAAKVRVEAGYDNNRTSAKVTRENGAITTTNQRWTNVYATTEAAGTTTYSTQSSTGATRYDAYQLKAGAESTDNLTVTIDGTSYPVYAVIFGWGMADGAQNAYAFKDIDNKSNYASNLGFTPWTTADYHRSFWEQIPTYARFQKGENLGGYTWNDYIGETYGKKLGDYTYTMPNTKQAVIAEADANRNGNATTNTKVVIAAKLMYLEGQTFHPLNRIHYMGTDYTEESAVKNIVLNGLKNMWYKANDDATEWRNLTADDLEFKTVAGSDNKTSETTNEAARNYEVTLTLASSISETGVFGRGTTKDGVTKIESNGYTTLKNLVESNKALIYNGGDTYYYTTLRHLGTDAGKWGYFGVVRNHLYDVTITGIAGWGTPVYDPDVWVIPETPEDVNTYLAARINVLSWRVVPQDVNIDGTTKPKS